MYVVYVACTIFSMPNNPRKYSEEDFQQMSEMLRDGKPLYKIAQIFNTAGETLKRYLLSRGVVLPKRSRTFTEEDAATIFRMLDEGKEVPEIASVINSAAATIWKFLRKHGFQERTKADSRVFDGPGRVFACRRFLALRMHICDGLSTVEIGKHFGCSPAAVSKFLSRYILVRKPERRKRDTGDFATYHGLETSVCELKVAGAKSKDIAAACGITLPAVMRILRENNLQASFRSGIGKLADDQGLSDLVVWRLLAVERLGGHCCLCSEDRYQVLCIDHQHGTNRPSTINGKRNTTEVKDQYRRIALGESISGCRVLCYNCNIIHEYERGNRKSLPRNIKELIRSLLRSMDENVDLKQKMRDSENVRKMLRDTGLYSSRGRGSILWGSSG